MDKLKQWLDQRSQAERFDELYPFFPRMREIFREKAHWILAGGIGVKDATHERRVGIEIEVPCLKNDGNPLDEETRNRLVKENKSLGW